MVSLSSSVAYWARAEPDRLAIVYGEQRVSYGALNERVGVLAALLQRRGIRKGDVVALLMKNSSAFLEAVLAIGHLGAVLLPLNYRLSRDEVDYIVGHAGASLMLVDEELEPLAQGFAQRLVLGAQAQQDTRQLSAGRAEEALAEGPPCQPGDLFRLMYTSGTTDRPKGVTHVYSNFYWKCLDHIAALGLTGEDRVLVVGPLYHVGAFDLPGAAVLILGGALVVLREFDPGEMLAAIEREKVSCGWLAPVMLNRTLAFAGRGHYDVSSLRWVIGGGERTPESRVIEFTSLFTRGRYIDAYGLTETCGGDTFMQAGREIEKIGSAGRATANVQIEIRDDAGRPLAADQDGEICLRGPKVTTGYWRDPAKTAASFYPGGWFRTGDVGHLDAEGFLYLTDRMKDMIISGGENIASSEVERVLYQLPQVAEAVAIGLPDEKWGERVVAVVVPRAGQSLTLAQVQTHCRQHLAGFKLPRQLICLSDLPRNPSGKVLKRVLRAQLAAEQDV